PKFSPFRLLSNGVLYESVKIINVLNPLIVNLLNASLPPTITRSNCPEAISLAPNITALAAEEQAVLIVVTNPSMPKMSAILCETSPASCEVIHLRISGLSIYTYKDCSVLSIPPTLVEETKPVG